MSDPLTEDITLEAAKILLAAQRDKITRLQAENNRLREAIERHDKTCPPECYPVLDSEVKP